MDKKVDVLKFAETYANHQDVIYGVILATNKLAVKQTIGVCGQCNLVVFSHKPKLLNEV